MNDLVAASFPVSAKLGAAAFLLAVIFGVSAGVIAALKQNTKWDYSVMGLAMTGVAAGSWVRSFAAIGAGSSQATSSCP